jgi:hypothetical protein
MKRAVLWVSHGANPAAGLKVMAFVPENPQPRPSNVEELKFWLDAGWRPHSAGGITAAEWGGGSQSGAIRFVTVLTLEYDHQT